MLELLAPAGSPEAVTAAVQSGADAVYLGYGAFNARRNAKNFSLEELAAAVSYCHTRGVKVYLTLNTLVTDRELPSAAQVAEEAAGAGVDAVLIQDLGVLRMLRQVAPQLPVHGSTQLTVHSLDGVRRCADLGMTRVVLSRELSRDAMETICLRSPIEIETFVHGALCMCYSGQCYFSSVIGGRSGNRGLCAQPCRLKYGWGDKADGYPLSLKDMSLAGHLQELKKLGIKCLKIEGRMKRPEYVSIVTGIYARAIREDREPTPEELGQLEAAFSRQGFTDGYYLDRRGPDMFGVREETREPRELFAQARAHYQSGERQSVGVVFYVMVRAGEPVQVGVQDEMGHTVTAAGPVPETARTKDLTAETVEKQLARTGGTPYLCRKVRALVEPGLSVPVAALNALRREVLEGLTRERGTAGRPPLGAFHPGVRYENRREPPVLTLSLRTAQQFTRELAALAPALVCLPLEEVAAHPETVALALERGCQVGAILPRICWDRERETLRKNLETVRAMGVSDALVGTLDLIAPAREAGFTLRGDYSLPVFNTQALKELKRLGFVSATVSFELKLAQIRDISKPIDIELLVYGRLPLMITENCIIKNHAGRCACDNGNLLTDRKGERFPVVKAPGCRNEILNAKKLFLADKRSDYQKIGAWGARLFFTTENPRECVQVAERYLGRGRYEPHDFTRGLYYRDVE